MYSKKKIEEFEDLVVWQKGIQIANLATELSRMLSRQIQAINTSPPT